MTPPVVLDFTPCSLKMKIVLKAHLIKRARYQNGSKGTHKSLRTSAKVTFWLLLIYNSVNQVQAPIVDGMAL